MADLKPQKDPKLLVGFDAADDAGVYLVSDDLAIVQTVDIITPLVDDAAVFGRIAAANSLSDLYAMGARPITALNIAAFPDKKLDLKYLKKILHGSLQALKEAKVALLGGHTICDDEIKYGLAVTGVVHPKKIITNSKARPGDAVILCKPIGTGVITTALKRTKVKKSVLSPAIESMLKLNRRACELMLEASTSAATDVTGFGLIGHSTELAKAGNVVLSFSMDAINVFDGARELVAKGFSPGGTKRNMEGFDGTFKPGKALSGEDLGILFDPQTSGGLLICVKQQIASKLLTKLKRSGYKGAAIIGTVKKRPARNAKHYVEVA